MDDNVVRLCVNGRKMEPGMNVQLYTLRHSLAAERNFCGPQRAYYDECSQEVRKIVIKVNGGSLPATDGSQAVRLARMRESVALEEYLRVLRIYSELVSGKMLEEDVSD
jgi:hypothetical protein